MKNILIHISYFFNTAVQYSVSNDLLMILIMILASLHSS